MADFCDLIGAHEIYHESSGHLVRHPVLRLEGDTVGWRLPGYIFTGLRRDTSHEEASLGSISRNTAPFTQNRPKLRAHTHKAHTHKTHTAEHTQ